MDIEMTQSFRIAMIYIDYSEEILVSNLNRTNTKELLLANLDSFKPEKISTDVGFIECEFQCLAIRGFVTDCRKDAIDFIYENPEYNHYTILFDKKLKRMELISSEYNDYLEFITRVNCGELNHKNAIQINAIK